MSTTHHSRSDIELGDEHAFDVKVIDADRAADDINNRVDRAHLMEVNFLGRFVMNFALGGGELLEDQQRQLFDLQ